MFIFKSMQVNKDTEYQRQAMRRIWSQVLTDCMRDEHKSD